MKKSNLVTDTDSKATLKKAYLIYTDYTLSSDPEEKEALLDLLSMYIHKLDNLKAELVYHSICMAQDSEKESYTEILGDILIDSLDIDKEV